MVADTVKRGIRQRFEKVAEALDHKGRAMAKKHGVIRRNVLIHLQQPRMKSRPMPSIYALYRVSIGQNEV
jgi:hypothetical protein